LLERFFKIALLPSPFTQHGPNSSGGKDSQNLHYLSVARTANPALGNLSYDRGTWYSVVLFYKKDIFQKSHNQRLESYKTCWEKCK